MSMMFGGIPDDETMKQMKNFQAAQMEEHRAHTEQMYRSIYENLLGAETLEELKRIYYFLADVQHFASHGGGEGDHNASVRAMYFLGLVEGVAVIKYGYDLNSKKYIKDLNDELDAELAKITGAEPAADIDSQIEAAREKLGIVPDGVEPDFGHDFSDAGVVGAEMTADYCYAHQAYCDPTQPYAPTDPVPLHDVPVEPIEADEDDDEDEADEIAIDWKNEYTGPGSVASIGRDLEDPDGGLAADQA